MSESTLLPAESIKQASTQTPVLDLIRNRWSPRAFADRPIAETTLHTLFEAASWAPSAGNMQPWRYLYAHKDTEAFGTLVGCLTGGNQLWADKAAVLVVCIATTQTPEGKPYGNALHDLGMANVLLTLQARNENIYAHMMGGFDAAKVRESFGIEDPYKPVCLMALGYLGHHETLQEPFLTRELTPRSRRPLSAFAFRDKWAPEA